MSRADYHVVLEIAPTSSLTHGAGSMGNEQVLRTQEVLVDVPDPEMPGKTLARKLRVPIVTGSAFRATLREHSFGHLAETLGLEDGTLDRDRLRLLLKGGKNDSGGASVSLEEHRRLRHLFPMLAVFGSMDGGLPIRGQLQVSPIRPFAAELVDAGIVPREIAAMSVGDAGGQPTISVHPGREPVPLHVVMTREEYFRHDMRTSPHLHYLEGEAAKQLEDKVAARKGKVARKDERRDANESMPYSFQAISAGVPMVAELRLAAATQVEADCLFYAIARWIASGAQLGGGRGRGHGQCRVRCAGALTYNPGNVGATHPGTAISIDRPGNAYLAHLQEHADAIRVELTGKAAA